MLLSRLFIFNFVFSARTPPTYFWIDDASLTSGVVNMRISKNIKRQVIMVRDKDGGLTLPFLWVWPTKLLAMDGWVECDYDKLTKFWSGLGNKNFARVYG